MAMAISLPILISIFGFSDDALLPVLGFLIGIMKGATIGGAVPAILFNTPTPDAFMTAIDGYPMAKNGEARKALRVAVFLSTRRYIFRYRAGFCAPFLAIMVERYLDLPENGIAVTLALSRVDRQFGRQRPHFHGAWLFAV